ncbi:hypothetical protein [Streptomyces sp. WAC05858]|uniref:hypothetical protein n=1 Tax=Streptomyces TaxID=1883 RepID=UPI0021AE4088|nr:hypothetical protein [Streptomyces sp. WAC05858]
MSVLVARQAAERLVDDVAVVGCEFARLLGVVGDQCRRDGQAEVGGLLKLGGLEVRFSRCLMAVA